MNKLNTLQNCLVGKAKEKDVFIMNEATLGFNDAHFV